MFTLAHFGVNLTSFKHHLNSTAYPSVVADYFHAYLTTVYHLLMAPSSHKAQIVSHWFLEHDDELTVLQWPPQNFGDVVEQEIQSAKYFILQYKAP